MGSRTHHQLSSGMVVSGPPEQPKERKPTLGSRAVPYTGGDVKKSGELGKMFDIPVVESSSSAGAAGEAAARSSSSRPNSGSIPAGARSASHSGQLSRPSSSSAPQPPKKTSSGSLSANIPATGLITSGSLRSSSEGHQQPHQVAKCKIKYGPAVTSLGEGGEGYGFRIPRVVPWLGVMVLAMGVGVGVFLLVGVKNAVTLAAVGAMAVAVVLLACWNWARKRRDLEGFLRNLPDTDLLQAKPGDFVKVTGIVTCGSIPLDTSYQHVSRCVCISTELHEYRGWNGKPANPHHKRLTWGLRYSERYAADFYISDNHGGTRALVRTGNGVKVVSFVKPATEVETTKENRELHPEFVSWLADRNLSSDDRIMRIQEGYIKEASVISVVGILQRQDNVLMIFPPAEPVSTGCQWRRFLLPIYIEGIVLLGDKNPKEEVIIA